MDGKGDTFATVPMYSKYADRHSDVDDVLLAGGNIRRPTPLSQSWKPVFRFLRKYRWRILPTIVINLFYGWGAYNYAMTAAYPLPRGALNWTEGLWQSFIANLALYTFLTAAWDAFLFVFAFMETRLWTSASGKKQHFIGGVIGTLFGVILLTVAMAYQIAGAYLSARSYEQYCYNDWLQVEFFAHLSWNSTARNVATFSLVETGEPLFTFTSSDPAPGTFALAALNSSRPTVVPSLRSVLFDESAETFSGECFEPTETTGCSLRGSFKSKDELSFELIMSGSEQLTTSLRNIYSDWSFDKLPQVILHSSNHAIGELGRPLLMTSVAMPYRCDRLKVCVAHTRKSEILGPEVIVPTAWLLQKFAEYSVWCSTPKPYSGI